MKSNVYLFTGILHANRQHFEQINNSYLLAPVSFFYSLKTFLLPALNFYLFLVQLREYIDDTEDYINIQLDNHRNQLIQVSEC